MTPTEAAALLAVAAAFDNRKPDADAAQAWAMALDGLTFADCREAVVSHYRASNDWVMPATIRAAVTKLRDKRQRDHAPLVPPPGLSVIDDMAWLADANHRVRNGEVIDSEAVYGELVTGPAIDFRSILSAIDDKDDL